MQIEMTGIVCRFGSTPAVDGVDLAVSKGEFLALLGPSGSGKTTLLRIIAGLESPETGTLKIDGEDALALPPNQRRIGFVFQNYALFRHMSVARNIAFGLDIRPRGTRPAKADIKRRVEELLDLVQLSGLGRRFPHELSGGQRQRVALARALATEPRILLLDEPFGALDAQVRSDLRLWLKSLHQRLGITSIFVTHDQEEAMELADRVVIMRKGKLQQQGSPLEIYAKPASAFIYHFLGSSNRLRGMIDGGQAHIGASSLSWPAPEMTDGPVDIWFRPHQIELQPAHDQHALTGVVQDIAAAGARARVTILSGENTVTAELTPEAWTALDLSKGSECRWRPRAISLYRDGAS